MVKVFSLLQSKLRLQAKAKDDPWHMTSSWSCTYTRSLKWLLVHWFQHRTHHSWLSFTQSLTIFFFSEWPRVFILYDTLNHLGEFTYFNTRLIKNKVSWGKESTLRVYVLGFPDISKVHSSLITISVSINWKCCSPLRQSLYTLVFITARGESA